jgi:hypothetical protein
MEHICPNINCKKKFKFTSLLKKHLINSFHCSKEIIDINEYILEKKTNKPEVVIQIIKCDKCNIIYTRQSSLNRHIKMKRCNIPIVIKEEERQKQIEYLQKQIDKIKDKPQNFINNNNNINRIEQQTINNNNLTINNNITIIQHINPSGCETLPTNLSMPDMLKLLNLEDKGVIEIVKLVCEQEENKNFYKLNMNKNNISYLNNNYKIDVCQDKELKDKLLNQCVILTYRMLIACSASMSSKQIYNINSNLQNISQKMKEEIFDNGLKNIIEYELRNNSKQTKDKINKYTKEIISNQEIKDQAIHNSNKDLQIKEDTYKNKLPSITLYEINNKFGNPVTCLELECNLTFNDFNINRYEDTIYNKYWLKRIKEELKYIKSHPNKTIGDITYFETRKKNIYENIEKMKIINSQMREYDEYNNLIITNDNFKVNIANEYIKENDRLKLQNLLNNNNNENDE